MAAQSSVSAVPRELTWAKQKNLRENHYYEKIDNTLFLRGQYIFVVELGRD